ncbi:MAG: DUF6878 family protein [Rhodomicrobiaceae bacterium]
MTDNLPVTITNPPAPVEECRRQDPIYRTLRELGVHELRVRYSGSGDSGSINEVEARNKQGQPVELLSTPVPYTFIHTSYNFQTGNYDTEVTETKELPLSEAVEQWCYDLLEEHYPGWENDDGADGVIVIDPEKQEGRIDHQIFFMQSDFERRSFT